MFLGLGPARQPTTQTTDYKRLQVFRCIPWPCISIRVILAKVLTFDFLVDLTSEVIISRLVRFFFELSVESLCVVVNALLERSESPFMFVFVSSR